MQVVARVSVATPLTAAHVECRRAYVERAAPLRGHLRDPVDVPATAPAASRHDDLVAGLQSAQPRLTPHERTPRRPTVFSPRRSADLISATASSWVFPMAMHTR